MNTWIESSGESCGLELEIWELATNEWGLMPRKQKRVIGRRCRVRRKEAESRDLGSTSIETLWPLPSSPYSPSSAGSALLPCNTPHPTFLAEAFAIPTNNPALLPSLRKENSNCKCLQRKVKKGKFITLKAVAQSLITQMC